jgi:hypothetical protein
MAGKSRAAARLRKSRAVRMCARRENRQFAATQSAGFVMRRSTVGNHILTKRSTH